MSLVMMLFMVVACATYQSAAVLGYSTSSTAISTSPHAPPNNDSKAPVQVPDSYLDPIPVKVPWLIVGGGIHGIHIASRLLGSGTTPPSSVRIIDGSPHLLQKWKSRTAATGMKYLRSSAGYHLDLEENSLRQMFGNEGFTSDRRTAGQNASKKAQRKKKKRKHEQKKGVALEFANDYERPRLDIFNRHCDHVIEKYELDRAHTQGFVTGIEPKDDCVRVKVSLPDASDIIYEAEQIVLALGNDKPSYAEWVDEDDVNSGHIRHLMDINDNEEERYHKERQDGESSKIDADFSDDEISKRIAIVGGGITAAHKALELARRVNSAKPQCCTPPSIHLISRHPIKEQQFDTHQDWMMDRAASERSQKAGGSGTPKCQIKFSGCDCWKERRKIISQERVPGTVTNAVNRGKDGLRYAIESGAVQWHQAEIVQKKYQYAGDSDSNGGGDDGAGDTKQNRDKVCGIELTLSCGETIHVDEILLATGFGKKLPGGAMVQNDLVDRAKLPVSMYCGFPIVNENLQWHERIFVAGAMAELELGPSARNIAGARLAAERILLSQ